MRVVGERGVRVRERGRKLIPHGLKMAPEFS